MDYLLKMENISKAFPGVIALDKVNLHVKKGEVHAIAGENGAGKSTLLKILNGNLKMDSGHIYINEKEVNISSPQKAQENGIAIIFQELNLVPMLTIAENIFIGYMDKVSDNKMFVSWKDMYAKSHDILKHIGFDVDTRKRISELTVAEQQMVEIARAVSFDAKIILMDEPSASLTVNELENLFRVIRELKKKGVTVIYISHRLEEIFEICDTVTVLRDGEHIDTVSTKKTDRQELIEKMVGREVNDIFARRNTKIGSEVLRVEHLTTEDILKDVNLTLHKGEILGISGLVGSGRTEMARAIFGIDYVQSCEIYKNGQPINITNPANAIKQGLAFITEDRKDEGLIIDFPVKMNLLMVNIKRILKGLFISGTKEKDAAQMMVDQLKIKTPSLDQKVLYLSGGNQQKVVVGKWLMSNADVYIMDEPTRGIDVGAKQEIYSLMNALIEDGKSIIFISSELPELLGMSDRVLVMYEGEIKGELSGEEMTAVEVMKLCK